MMKASLKKALAAVLAFSTLATMAVGCSGSGSSSSASDSTSADSAASEATQSDVTLSMLLPSSNPTDGIKAYCADFEKKTGIKIDIELTASGSELDNIVKSRIASHDLPDILAYNSGSLLQPLNPANNFLDLTNEPFMANLDDEYKKSVTVDGKIYGVPCQEMSAGAVLYNTDIYSQLNLSVPKTWNDFIENCKKIKSAGKTPVLCTAKDSWTTQCLILGDYFNIEKQNPNFAEDYTANKAHFSDTPAALRGFEKLSQLKSLDFMNSDFMSVSYDSGEQLITDGSAAHWFILSQCLGDICKKFPDKANSIDIFPVPSDDANINGFTVWEPTSFYFAKETKNVDAVKKLAEYVTTSEAMTIYSQAEKLYGPVAIKNFEMPSDSLTAVKTLQKAVDAGNDTTALEFKSAVKGPNLMNICVECLTGKSAAECAKEYDEDVKQQAKQLNLAGW
jgi:raffinose/stachyose/melibiose transport system substrate-binding protein